VATLPSASLSNRGLQYGDGLFETVAVKAGLPRLWQAHRLRLARGLEQLQLADQELDWESLEAAVATAAAAQGEGSLKLVVTAGEGPRGYARGGAPLRWGISSSEPPARPLHWWRDGVELYLCKTRLGKNPALAGAKHLNRLEQVLARAEWSDPAIADGLMLDSDDQVICTTMANLFVVQEGRLITPDLGTSGVLGVMREQIEREAAAIGLVMAVEMLELGQLLASDEVFITNSLIGLWPVVRIAQQRFLVGPVATALQQRIASEALVPVR